MARLLITCGPTREPLDPVRYLSNASSGRTGIAIAAEALGRGHQVDLVLGPVESEPPPGAHLVRVVTCEEMLLACRSLHPLCQALIGVAAVCDFRPSAPLAAKRRREGKWTLELVANPDILAELSRAKGPRVHVGFALETETILSAALARAAEKLVGKGLDWVVLNNPEALGGEDGHYHLLGTRGPPRDLGRLSKRELAAQLVDRVEESLKLLRGGADKG